MANSVVGLRYVRGNFEHESISTTSYYLHADEGARQGDTDDRHKIS